MHKLKLQKVWFGSQSIVWATRLQKKGDDGWQKCFLEVSCRRKNYGAFLHAKKPSLSYQQGSLFSILRKNASSGYIKDVQKNKGTWQIDLVMQRQEAKITIAEDDGAVPILDFMIAGESLFRLKPDKIFTKKKPVDMTGLLTEEHSVLDKWVQSAKEISATKQEPENRGTKTETESEASLEFSELQKFRKKQMQRKRKTVVGSLKKNELNPSEKELLELLESELPKLVFPVENIEIEKILEKKSLEEKPQGKQLTFLHELRKKLLGKEKKAENYILKTQKELAEIESTIASLSEEYWDQRSLNELGKRFKLKAFAQGALTSAKPTRKPFAEYDCGDGVFLRMGRGAKENDALTKSISADTLWLHAYGGQGSHVAIIKSKRNLEITADHIRYAAVLALHHSKFKKDLAGEVHKTFKRHLKKTKDLPPGKWIVQKAETIYIRYSKSELELVLGMKALRG